MKFGNQSRSNWLIINMIFEIANLDAKFKAWAADLVSKLQCARFFMKCGTRNKLSMLIMNGIDDFDPKL